MELLKIWNPVAFVSKLYTEKVDKDRTNTLKEKYRKLLNNELSVEEIEYEELININVERLDELFEIFINDEESVKLDIYKRIYKAIRNNQINKKDYSKLMRIAKNLPSEALNLLPKIYVYSQNQNITRIPLANFLNSIQNSNPYICTCLMNEALLDKEPCCGGYNVIMLPLLNSIVKQFFKEEDLTIEKENISIWKCKIYIMNNGDCDNEPRVISRLLEKINIKGIEGATYRTNLKNSLVFNLIILFKDNEIDQLLIDLLKQIPQRINIIKISFHKNINDPIPNVGNKLIYIDLNDEVSKSNFLNRFVIED